MSTLCLLSKQVILVDHIYAFSNKSSLYTEAGWLVLCVCRGTGAGVYLGLDSSPATIIMIFLLRQFVGRVVLYVMQVFHWSRQAGNYAFLESRDQCLHGRLGSVASSWPVGKSQ